MGRWTGCICILTIVAARGGMTPLAVGVSSIYCRTVNQRMPQASVPAATLVAVAGISIPPIVVMATRAARNTRQSWVGCLAWPVGGGPDDRSEQDPSPHRGRADAPAPRRGGGAAVHRGRLLPGRRQ